MDTHVFAVYHTGDSVVMGLFETLDKARQFIGSKVAADWDADEFVVYREVLNVAHSLGEDNKNVVKWE
jgi:hypothetical protein